MVLRVLGLYAALLLATTGFTWAARFSVTHGMIGDVPTLELADSVRGQGVQVLPTLGGRVESLQLWSPVSKKVRDVLLSHNGNATAIKDNDMFKGAILLPFANRIAKGQYTFQGKAYQLDLNEPDRHNAIHGLLYNKKMMIEEMSGDESIAMVTLAYTFNGSDAGYPFPLRVKLNHILTDDAYVLNIAVTNLDTLHPLPFYAGFHPYFKVTDTAAAIVVLAQCSNYSLVDVDKTTMIPTGTSETTNLFKGKAPIGGTPTEPTFYDDGFVALESPAAARNCTDLLHAIYDELSRETVYLVQEPAFRYNQVFTGSVAISGEQGVALEPMSAETDAYNNHIGLSILSAGEKWQGAVVLSTGATSSDAAMAVLEKLRNRSN